MGERQAVLLDRREERLLGEAIQEARQAVLSRLPAGERAAGLERLQAELLQVLQSHWPEGSDVSTLRLHAILAAGVMEPDRPAEAGTERREA